MAGRAAALAAIDKAGAGVLSFRKLWIRKSWQRSPSPNLDLAYERSVDELFEPTLTAMPDVTLDAQPAQITLTNAELGHAWRASYRALRLTDDPRDLARIAAARACYLDAVQERDPAGFATWVCSEDAFWRDPEPFLVRDLPMDA